MHINGKYILSLIILLTALNSQAQLPKVKNPYPKGVPKKLQLGMSFQDFTSKFTNFKYVKEEYDFRDIMQLDVDHPDITQLILYFDTKGDKPLYEIIIVYKDNQQAMQSATNLFGSPNHAEKEWRATYKQQIIWSWVFKTKLIIVADIPETEWSDSF